MCARWAGIVWRTWRSVRTRPRRTRLRGSRSFRLKLHLHRRLSITGWLQRADMTTAIKKIFKKKTFLIPKDVVFWLLQPFFILKCIACFFSLVQIRAHFSPATPCVYNMNDLPRRGWFFSRKLVSLKETQRSWFFVWVSGWNRIWKGRPVFSLLQHQRMTAHLDWNKSNNQTNNPTDIPIRHGLWSDFLCITVCNTACGLRINCLCGPIQL